MSLGMFVSINQRLDAETISLVAEEYGFTVEFISVDVAESIDETEDSPEDLLPRPAIITVMGHVDHGKTSLLDYIRSANVIAGEAGGITQHIGAYSMVLESGRQITFLDTPGHEAFTAMRARGAQVTDIAIIIVAADDDVMPQTVEAINHASAAGVPIVFAINKIDRPNANPEKIKEELANMNYLVEEWGGKYQSQDISAKTGTNVDLLLEKVLLEADMLELKANPDKSAVGTVIESSLDKGRGFVTTLLVQAGTLNIGDLLLSGEYYGHVKAMFNERNKKVDTVGPSEPALILGLNGAPQAGEKFHVMENEREAREIATKRSQLQREQGLRTQKHITLDEIGRRIAIGNFQELNLIVKGDVDGSIEALSDSLIKLSTEEIQVNVIHKAVGQISESDIMLAAASNAIVIGFQVRPSFTARKLAEREEIDIRLYSIIYDAIEEITAAMEGMLSPEIKEKITATVEIRDVFKITKVGTVAGCMVKEGKVKRNSKARVIRDGIVVYTGELASLKRLKEDVKEVASG
jgi:translation initiation factor IF-2